MNHYHDKTKQQLIVKIKSLKNRVEELEQSEVKFKRAEEELRESEERLSKAQEVAKIGSWEMDITTEEAVWSDETYRLFGLEPQEFKMTFERLKDFLYPEDRKTVLSEVREAMANKENYEGVYRIVRRDNEVRFIHSIAAIEHDESGKPVLIRGTVQDITERKRTEEALIESKRMLNDVLNTIPVRVFWKDLDGVYLGCNQLFAKDAGRSNPEEVIGDNDYNMGWAEQAELYRSDDRSVIESGQPKINYEEPQTTPDGDIIWLSTSKIPLRNSSGAVYSVLGTYEDITERKKAEEALHISEEMFKGIFSQAPVGIELYDSEGNLINANQECLNIFGVRHLEEVKGFKLFEDPNISEETKIQLRNGLPIDYESEFDFELVKKLKLYKTARSGKCFLHVQITPYKISDSGETGFVVHVQDITERKKAEEKIRQQQEELQIILDSVPALVFYKDKEDRFIRVNKALAQAFNMSKEEIIGKTAAELSPVKDYWEDDKRVIETGIPSRNIIEPLKTPEGTIWAQTDKIPYKDYDGNIVGIIGFAIDITEHKRAEEALQKSEEKYRLLFESIPDVITTIDEQGIIISANNSVKRILGYEPSELLGKPVEILAPEELRSEQKENIIKAINEGFLESQETIRVAKDGTRIPIDISVFTSKDSEGNLFGVSAIMRDITDRKRAEDTLREKDSRYRLLIETSTAGINLLDKDGNFLVVNEPAAKDWGKRPVDLINKNVKEVLPPEFADEVLNIIQKVSETGIGFEQEKFIEPLKKHFIENIQPIFDDKKKFLGVQVMTFDITERKQAEQNIRDSEYLLRESQKVANLGSYVLDIPGGIWKSSPILDDVFGIDKKYNKDITNWLNIVHPEDRAMMQDYFAINVLTNHESFNKEYRIIRFSDKQERWVHGLGELEFDAEGNAVKMIGTIQDITKRKKAEEEIRKLSHSVEQSPAIVMITDISGNIEYVNPKFEEVTGYTAKEVIGKNPNILKGGETTTEEYEILWKTIKAGGEWHGEFHNRKKNGELYWESASISAIKDTKGQLTHYIAIKEDITGRKAMDKRLRESHNRLRSFAERLQMIREEERATIAREIHDDLGQSLTALKMDISWVKNNPEMGVEAKTAKFDMMLDLINSTIQTVKRIATELRPGILDDLGLVPAIEWQAAEFQSRFKIQCNVSINKSDVIVKDEISIAVFRIFQETLTNVARHSGATRVDIKLNFHVDNKLIMEIADNGVGIDEEQINSPKSLGLFGMRERVNILNGEMEIIGEQGKGTRVRAFIPVSIEELANSK